MPFTNIGQIRQGAKLGGLRSIEERTEEEKSRLQQNLSNHYDSKYNRRYGQQPDRGRSAFMTAIDLLSTGTYASAGFARGLVDDELNPFVGMGQGIKAGFTGKEEYRHTYSRVLDDMGWQPDTTSGKIARGAVGLVGDIFLDPVTYLTGGMSALVKGTGKKTARVTHGMSRAMGASDAKHVVRGFFRGRNMPISPAQLDEASGELARHMNSLAGFSKQATPLRLSFEGAPFGRKIFGKHSSKGIELVSAETMQRIGDSTFAPVYEAVRDTFFGSRLGDLFSTKKLAYQASKQSPEALLEVIAPKMRKDMLKRTSRESFNAFRKRANELNFDDATAREIFDALEDRSVWSKVKEMVNIRNVDESGKYVDRVDRKFQTAKKNVDNLEQKINRTRGTVEDITQELNSDYRAKAELQTELDDLLRRGEATRPERNRLQNELSERNNLIRKKEARLRNQNKHIADYQNKVADLEVMRDSEHILSSEDNKRISRLKKKLMETEDTIGKADYAESLIRKDLEPMRENIVNKASEVKKFSSAKAREATQKANFSEVVDRFTPEGVTLSPQRKTSLRGKLQNAKKAQDGSYYINYSTWKSAESLGDATGWDVIRAHDGTYRVTVPDDVVQGASIDSASIVTPKTELIGDIGEFAFGDQNVLSETISPHHLDELTEMIRKGSTPADLQAHIEANRFLLRNEYQEMYSAVASELGYKNFKRDITDPMMELGERIRAGDETLTRLDLERFRNYEEVYSKRQYLVNSLKNLDPEERASAITSLKDQAIYDALDDTVQARRGVEGASYNEFDHRSLKFDFDKHLPEARAVSEPTGVERQLLNKKSLSSEEASTLWRERKKRWRKIDDALNTSQRREATKRRSSVYSRIQEKQKVNQEISDDIARLRKEKPAGYIDEIKKLNNVRKQEMTRIQNSIDSGLREVEEYHRRALHARDFAKNNNLSTPEIAYKNNIAKVLDEKKDAIMTDLYDSMMRESGRNIRPGELTEYDLAYLEEAYNAVRYNVLEGANGNVIDVQNLTADQYKQLLKQGIERADSLAGVSRINPANADGSLRKAIAGRKTIQEVTKEIADKKARMAKQVPDTVADKFRHISTVREEAKNRALRLQQEIDEVYNLSYQDKISGLERQIETQRGYMDRIRRSADQTTEEIAQLEREVSEIGQTLQEHRERANRIGEIRKRLRDYDRNIDKLESQGRELKNSLVMDQADFSKAKSEYNRIERVLSDDKLLHDYIMDVDNRVISKAEKADLLDKFETVEYVLRDDVDISDRAREYANMIRKDLQKMGMEEVRINKLTDQQFQNMIQGYLPRVITKEGKQFFKSKAQSVDTVKGFGDTFGFGRQFNPHGKSRTIDALYDANGNLIKENPTLREINRHFAENFPELKGKNVFSENLQELFLARAKKHVDLMYDNQYMNELTEIFGVPYEPWMKGAKGKMATANIGRFRQDANNFAKIERQMVIDDAVENFIATHKYRRINQATGEPEMIGVVDDVKRIVRQRSERQFRNRGYGFTEEQYAEQFGKYLNRKIEAFTKKEFPDHLRREMVESNINEFLNKTGTSGYLDDLSMPFLEFDERQADSIVESIQDLKRRRLDQIKGGSKGLVDDGVELHGNLTTIRSERGMTYIIDSETGEIVKMPRKKGLTGFLESIHGGQLPQEELARIGNADVSELRQILDENLPFMNHAEYDRYKRYVNKLNTLDNLKGDTVRHVPQGMTERFNNSRKLQIQRDNNEMLNLWDKMTKFVKLNQTTVTPGFHGKNKMGNTFRNWLELGMDAIDPDMQRQTLNVVRKKGKVSGGFDIVRADGSTGYMSWEDAWDMADDLGVTSGGWFAFDGASGADVPGRLGLKGKYNPFDMENFGLYNKGAEIGKVVEDQDRFLHFVSKLKKGVSPMESASSSQKFLFDYGDLTFFEQSVMKRIMPYYTWMRKNTPLQLEMMLENPKKFVGVAKVYRGIEGMNDEDDLMDSGFINEFAQDWIQTPFNVTNRDGREEHVLWNPNLPFMDISNIPNPFRAEQSAKNMFSSLNPLITQPIEQAFNKNVFFDSPIVREDDNALASRIDHTLRQLVPYNVGKGLIQKEGGDRALHAWNNATGIRFLSYDYNMYRAMKLEELSNMTNQEYFDMMNERTWEQRRRQQINSLGKDLPSRYSRAMHGITNFVDGTKPTPAGMYDGALRPISQQTFNELSEEEQAKYIPPDNETAWAYHKQAVELEREAFEESRAPVRFVWGLFDKIGERKENQGEYQIGRVTNIVDGDTFDIDVGGEVERIRPLLVDTPELDHSGGGNHEPYAEEATEFADDFLFDKDVRIIFDGNNVDMYGRTLGYVELPGEGVDFNRELLERGYALTDHIFEPSYDRLYKYSRVEREAKRDHLRLHGK